MAVSNVRQATSGSPDKLALLRHHPLFGRLPLRVIEHLGSYMRKRALVRGETIFAKGDPGSGLMGVLSGSVKISVPSADGRDIVLRISIREMTDCELMVIERRDFIRFLRSQPDLMMQIVEILCSRLRWTTEQVQDVSFLDLPTRLAKALLRLVGENEGAAGDGKLTITQRALSQVIGRSRESTNKQLRIWAKQDWVRLKRGAVTVLQPEKLVEQEHLT